MAEEVRSLLKQEGNGVFVETNCPKCGVDLTEDGEGMRLRIVVGGHAMLEARDDTMKTYQLGYSYSEDDKREEYVCYNCDTVLATIVKE